MRILKKRLNLNFVGTKLGLFSNNAIFRNKNAIYHLIVNTNSLVLPFIIKLKNMSLNYKLTVNDALSFDFDKDSISQLDAVGVETNKYHILHQNIPYKAEVVSSDFNKKSYQVKVNNSTYNVVIADDLDILIKDLGFEIGKTKQVNAIKAPMPGLILEIGVSVGQEVKTNDNLLILGAMKMENSFLSPRDGTIKAIKVNVGDAVVKGQLLIEFE